MVLRRSTKAVKALFWTSLLPETKPLVEGPAEQAKRHNHEQVDDLTANDVAVDLARRLHTVSLPPYSRGALPSAMCVGTSSPSNRLRG